MTTHEFVFRVALSRLDLNSCRNTGRSSKSSAPPVTSNITEGICTPQPLHKQSLRNAPGNQGLVRTAGVLTAS